MPDTLDTIPVLKPIETPVAKLTAPELVSGTRLQNTVAQATEFVVVSFWQPKSSSGEGNYHHETFTDQRDAEDLYRDYERGEWAKARAVCIFASRHGVPIGRVL